MLDHDTLTKTQVQRKCLHDGTVVQPVMLQTAAQLILVVSRYGYPTWEDIAEALLAGETLSTYTYEYKVLRG